MTEMVPGLISIITINYKQWGATQALLRSANQVRYPHVEWIVVDNASGDFPLAMAEVAFPHVKFVVSEKNLGFAGGNNLAAKHARGEFFFFVNNDTVLSPGLLTQLWQNFNEFPDLGLISPKVLYMGSPTKIQYAGYTPIHRITGRNQTLGEGELDEGQYDRVSETAYAHGAAMMIRREVFEQTGGMPEEYFLYYEELDWSEQIKVLGKKICYDGRVYILHHASLSTGSQSPLYTYYYNRNRILFMIRNASLFSRIAFFLYVVIVLVPKNLIFLSLRGKWRHLSSFCRAILWHVKRPFLIRSRL